MLHECIMDITKNLVKKSWNQQNSGLKAKRNHKVTLGNFRLVNNLGPLNKNDKTSTGNRKFVSDSSDYTRYKTQYATHKTWKNDKNVVIVPSQ